MCGIRVWNWLPCAMTDQEWCERMECVCGKGLQNGGVGPDVVAYVK